ncbi:MAG: glycoside hydrolase family 16 protein [Lachnospiraceae bacterium]|nr:glycoside hydrolase family 16 protein [Lachnospiraceae bacterium]MBR2036609.1 glycoside hydrolase family 16 protein [Lachnospiraceae bacterium]MBR3806782.1 glycoside hydrolase family 16 protein [Lachnospiraceae bacterium]
MKEYKVEGHVSSFLPADKNWKLVWSDEFDGTELDKSKWDYRLCMMGRRHHTWGAEGVEIDGNSNAVFTVYEKDGMICSSQLQTGYNYMDAEPDNGALFDGGLVWPIGKLQEHKFLHRYGYYECRCKLQQKKGWWSAFWLQSPVIGSSLNPEVSGIENDIMESFEPGNCFAHYNHYNGYGVDHQHAIAGNGMDLNKEEFHTFGLLWTEEGYTFYVDGKEDGHIPGPVSKIPQFILLTTEVDGYRKAEHAPTEDAKLAVGDKFIVDYVRVFDIIE